MGNIELSNQGKLVNSKYPLIGHFKTREGLLIG